MNNFQHNYEVPNGGYGYFVVFGAMVINATNQAVISIFGLLFEPYFTSLKESKTRIALVMNLSSVFLNLSGLMIAPLLKKFSPRQVAITGCSLVGFGFMLSSQTTKLEQVLVTYSFMVGIGLGVLGPSIFLAITPYFTTKKSRAMGLAMAGTGFGQMLLPQIVKTFLNISDFSGASLFVGCLALFGIAGATFFHPVELHMKKVEGDSESLPLIPAPNGNTNGVIANGHGHSNGWEKLPKNGGIFNKISRSLDLSLLKDVRFVIINIGLAVVYAVSVDFTLILPFFLQDSAAGLNRSQIAICMSILAFFDLLSRLTFHHFTDRLNMTQRSTYMVGIIALGLVRSTLAELTTYQNLMIACGFFGYIRALPVVTSVLTVSEYIGKYHPEKLSGALGLNMVFKGSIVFIVGQFLGWIRDYTGNYNICLHVQNILLSIIMIVWIIELTWYKTF